MPIDLFEKAPKDLFASSAPKDLFEQKELSSKFIPQMTKALYEGVPFGKRVISMMPNAEELKAKMEATPEPSNLIGGAGRFVGEIASAAPAIAGAEATIPGKIFAGAIGFGTQVAGQRSSEGKKPLEALGEGALTAGAAYAGGKALQGVGYGLSHLTDATRGLSGRIGAWTVKLPTKAYRYGKDPLPVMTEEKVVGNTIHDMVVGYEERLAQRTNELKQAVAGSEAKVDLEGMIEQHLKEAADNAKGSLQDRSAILSKLDYLRNAIAQKFGDLKNMKLSDAVDLKRQLADDFPFTVGDAEGNILSKIAHRMHHGINESIEKVAPEVSNLNQRVSSLIDISKAVKNRAAIENRQNPLGLIGSLIAVSSIGGVLGAGGAYATHQDIRGGALVGAVALKALSSPAVLSRLAKGLSTMADIDKISLHKAYPWFVEALEKFKHDPEGAMKILATQGKVGAKEATIRPAHVEILDPRNRVAIPAPGTKITDPRRLIANEASGEAIATENMQKRIPSILSDEQAVPVGSPKGVGGKVAADQPAQRTTQTTNPQGEVAQWKKAGLFGNKSGMIDIGKTSNLGFFSKAERVINEKIPNNADATQVRNTLLNSGVKPDEIEQLGLNRLTGKISKEDLQTLVKAHQVPLEEKVLGQEQRLLTEEEFARLDELIKRNKKKPLGAIEDDEPGSWNELLTLENIRDKSTMQQLLDKSKEYEMMARREQARGNKKMADKYWERSNHYTARSEELGLSEEGKGGLADKTKFGQYQLPGGENYREVLIKLPEQNRVKGDLPDGYGIKQINTGTAQKWVINGPGQLAENRYASGSTKLEAINNFWNLHGSQYDSFKSSHFDDPNILVHARINDRMVDGKKTLFIEEIQSDWHQKGRKDGYKASLKVEQDEDGFWRVIDKNGKRKEMRVDGHMMSAVSDKAIAEEQARLMAEGVPDAPFKKTWHELMFKRLLDKAVKEGYDSVAWTTGEQQAARYKLSDKIDDITWGTFQHPNSELSGTRSISIYPSGGDKISIGLDKSGRVISATPEIRGGDIIGKDIEDVVGKEVGQKIKTENEGELSGGDLDIGGSGMKGFYDQMLPSFVNKYTKKWGGKVGKATLYTPKDASKSYEFNTEKVHSLEITPAMREEIMMKGQPLFSAIASPLGAMGAGSAAVVGGAAVGHSKDKKAKIKSIANQMIDDNFGGNKNFKKLVEETAQHESHSGKLSDNFMRVDGVWRSELRKPKYAPQLAVLGARRRKDGSFDMKDDRTQVALGLMRYMVMMRRGDKIDTMANRAKTWKRMYNTKAGKGTPEKYIKSNSN